MGELARESDKMVTKRSRIPPAFSLSKKDVKVFVNFIFVAIYSFQRNKRMIQKDILFIFISQTYTIATLNPFGKTINRIFFVILVNQILKHFL
jgi:hypothetical protein